MERHLRCEVCDSKVRFGVLRLVKWSNSSLDCCPACVEKVDQMMQGFVLENLILTQVPK